MNSLFLNFRNLKVNKLLASTACLLFAGFQAANNCQAQETFLEIWSDQGDFVGGGQHRLYNQADGVFRIRPAFGNLNRGIEVAYQDNANPVEFWNLDFGAPNQMPLVEGYFPNAERFPALNAQNPGLSISGEGRGCNQLIGQFIVHQLVIAEDGSVERFAAYFWQRCLDEPGNDGLLHSPLIFGQIRFNYGFEIGDADADGVDDEKDKCANTISGMSVDASGCSKKQFCTEHVNKYACIYADWKNDANSLLYANDCSWITSKSCVAK